MPAVAEIVRRLWERQRAGTRPAPTVLLLFGGRESEVYSVAGREREGL